MATMVRLRNVSGGSREVPLPAGGYVIVAAGDEGEFEADHAARLAEQAEVWQKAATKKGGGD
ncbi:MAG TPA: hypothetical protein PK478_02840 [Nitrospira sp.]|jgi:hypothetical protein|nr:hypothetical protein [Nitrospira sp.]HQW88756.1 hypothetical protein [Nitrospira sp.]HQZ90467.1 hypothetical protein [Thermomicrobiales bacterium]HRA32649.1 hypothetical protein [Thermomicrobiales bacterium]